MQSGNRSTRKIAFVSPHCVLDYASGAATATRDGLHVLSEQGFQCEAFCGTRFDALQDGLIQDSLAQRGERYEIRKAKIGPYEGRLLYTTDGKLPVTLFENVSTSGGSMSAAQAQAFLTGCDIFLRRNRPDLVWTYGGDPVAVAVQRLAKRLKIPVLFTLYNFAYGDRTAFEAVDCVAVPCEFSRRYYLERLGLACQVLPVVVNWKAAQAPNRSPRFLTFINPQDIKGVYVFARIARELARRRPDIPLLVTQGRSRPDALNAPELGLVPHLAGQFPIETGCGGRNIITMPFAPAPRTFYPTVYSLTKLLLMPSLWYESFGLVAAQAMLNGIPVLASNRGALPETIGDAGFLFDVPARYTPETPEVPMAEEVEPWVETIIRLWDDAEYYEHWSRAASERAQQWHPDRLAPIYREFFSRITHQPGPPLVPKKVAQ
jgi:glycosyltransferase involved in cell wall biosynthesis